MNKEVKQEVMIFAKTISASSSETLIERVKDFGTVENVRVRFYPGQGRDLKVRVFANRKGNHDESLITFANDGDVTLSGDDDDFVFDVKIPVSNDDNIKVIAENQNATYDYTLLVYVSVDYHSGMNRSGVR